MNDNHEDTLLLICQCVKTLFTRQEKGMEFSRAAFEALRKRLPLERDDAQRLGTLQRKLDDAPTLEAIHALFREVDSTILALKPLQENS